MQTNALRGQPALLFFPCVSACHHCRAFFQSMETSEEFAYWSIRPLWVDLAEGERDRNRTVTEIVDTEGRCHHFLTAGGPEPALTALDSYQEFRAAFEFAEHHFPHLQDLESWVRSALLASPG